MPIRDSIVVLAQARSLKRAALAGRTEPLLRGRNFGLVCEDEDADEAVLFRRAASELGAHVAHVQPVLDERTPENMRSTARVLGRLYDAIDIENRILAPGLVRLVAHDAGVPVYNGVASASHPTARLADLLDNEHGTPDDNRRFVLQAVLLTAVA